MLMVVFVEGFGFLSGARNLHKFIVYVYANCSAAFPGTTTGTQFTDRTDFWGEAKAQGVANHAGVCGAVPLGTGDDFISLQLS